MRITRLRILNFRNLADIDLKLIPGTVVVGENRAGKSNLIDAMRLVLDPHLSYADQQLSREDFWDGLSDGSAEWNPMTAGEVIEVAIEVEEFDHDARLVTALADALLPEEPMRARLTYRFAPIDTGGGDEAAPTRYRGQLWGGEVESGRLISTAARSYIYLHTMGALRNVEDDIRSWRRSPLRALLERASREMNEESLASVAASLEKANDSINSLSEITDLSAAISARLTDMIGPSQAMETELAVTPDDPARIIRSMQLFVEGDAHRHLSTASLGTLNVLYLALLELGLQARLDDLDIAHVVVAIEEPEAHLHPHLQRLIFRRLLATAGDTQTVMVTTQSPHIASVADPRSLIVLRSDTESRASTACTAHDAALDETEWDDIARYLDVTRAEMVFARAVLLVEGFAEEVVLPTLAHQFGIDLDKLGITVCGIHGTHFGSYVAFCEALGIRWAVLTDGDPDAKVTGQERVKALLAELGHEGDPAQKGIFLGEITFEYDVASVEENRQACYAELSELCAAPSRKVIASWGSALPDHDTFMNMVDNAGGKGRYAQRLARGAVQPPQYIAAALTYLAAP
ncbi:AAA family ATPase [Mycobacterium sp.]|uniref:ATP-dependent nuclease n=1 Tax=Mycobacterium sp. TaxID=1785 RepID=UPI0025F272B8|nr:AAA family ATPase [Mycobacterium sp.]